MFNTKIDEINYHKAPTQETNKQKSVKRKDKYIKVIMFNSPAGADDDSCVVQKVISGNILDIEHKNLFDNHPNTDSIAYTSKLLFLQLPWATYDTKCTL